MQYANVRSEVIDYLGEFAAEFDIDAIREEAPGASTIDDIDPDAFAYIIESNAL